MKLVLIRHTTLDIPNGICYGQSNVDVSHNFPLEAQQVKQRLQHYHLDEIYTSPLQRCVKLANFCGFPNAIQDARLMELNFGDWEMQKWNDINDPYLHTWFDNWLHYPTKNGESLMDQYQRYCDFIDSINNGQKKTTAIFTHGGIIHCARIHAGLNTFENTFDCKPDYGEIVEITLSF